MTTEPKKSQSSDVFPEILYHYCSMEAFYGIITSRCLWLSDSSCMNDSLENKWVDHNLENYLSGIIDEGDMQRIVNNCEKFGKSEAPFIFCLSELEDKLSQWTGYAQEGAGVAIGFDTNKLLKQLDIKSTRFDMETDDIFLSPVIYDPNKQKEILQNSYSFLISNGTKRYREMAFMFQTIPTLNRVFKNPAFDEEKEWRLVYMPKYSYDKQIDLDLTESLYFARPAEEISYRISNSFLTAYFELPNKKEGRMPLPILKILLGSKNLSEEFQIERFLKANGYDLYPRPEILRSTASYR